MRYDTCDSNNDTRRERNTRAGVETPEFYLPVEGMYLWEWFGDINNSVSRIDYNAGIYNLISPTEFLAWSTLTGNEILPEEYEILRAMDIIFCKEMNLEISSERIRREDLEKNKVKINRRG